MKNNMKTFSELEEKELEPAVLPLLDLLADIMDEQPGQLHSILLYAKDNPDDTEEIGERMLDCMIGHRMCNKDFAENKRSQIGNRFAYVWMCQHLIDSYIHQGKKFDIEPERIFSDLREALVEFNNWYFSNYTNIGLKPDHPAFEIKKIEKGVN